LDESDFNKYYSDIFPKGAGDIMPMLGFRLLVFYDEDGTLGYKFTQDEDDGVGSNPISTLLGVLELVKSDIALKANLISGGYIDNDEDDN